MNNQAVILLIEDSSSQALWFQQMLTQAGYTVKVANDGAEGWCCACHTRPDLILLDINLPKVDGFGVLYLIKHCYITATIPVIMLTITDNISDVEYALALGADGYMFKDDYFLHQDGAYRMIDEVNRLMCPTVMRQTA